MLTILLATFIFSLPLLWWVYSIAKEENMSIHEPVVDPAACALVIACKGYDDSGHRNIISKIQSRAYPNQRLVRTFGIDNAFTTTNEKYRKSFTADAKRKIMLDDGRWKYIAETADLLVGSAFPQSGKGIGDLRLDSLVQSVTLKISLHVLFDLDPLQLDDESIQEIAGKIHFLWSFSSSTRYPSDDDQKSLRKALGIVIPGMGSSARENPLNLILPAYETMWRVVLCCFIEVTFRQGARPEWRQILSDFLSDPTKTLFEDRGSRLGVVSAADITNEALRLYPPTKRVYRKFHMAGRTNPELVTAHIEGCHRNLAIWGNDSWLFRPSRWSKVGNEARNAFMPFGSDKFTCPAKQDFGPRMIGVLVAALAAHIIPGDWELGLCVGGPDGREGLDGEKPLLSSRTDYEWIDIRRRGPGWQEGSTW